MNESAARIFLLVIVALGVCVWMIDLWLFVQMGRVPTQGTAAHVLDGMTPDEVLQEVSRRVVPGADVLEDSDRELKVARGGFTASFDVERSFGGALLNVSWDAAPMGRKYLVIMAVMTLIVIPAVLSGVTWVIWTLAVPNPNPAIRWQVLQSLQISHVLWPPFLIWTLHGRVLAGVRREVENLHFLILAERPVV